MARYIDADVLYGKLYPLDLVDKKLYTINAKAVADAIAKTPAADVVEVVRCKDCKYWEECCYDPIIEIKYGECYRPLGECGGISGTAENDFCSYGERKE